MDSISSLNMFELILTPWMLFNLCYPLSARMLKWLPKLEALMLGIWYSLAIFWNSSYCTYCSDTSLVPPRCTACPCPFPFWITWPEGSSHPERGSCFISSALPRLMPHTFDLPSVLRMECSQHAISKRIISGWCLVDMKYWSPSCYSEETACLFILLWITS